VSLLILLVCTPHFPLSRGKVWLTLRAAGDYTVILSAFEPDQTGKFTLKVESTSRFELKSIPQEGAGMYVKTVRGEWYVWPFLSVSVPPSSSPSGIQQQPSADRVRNGISIIRYMN
jgi:hypothetical protein